MTDITPDNKELTRLNMVSGVSRLVVNSATAMPYEDFETRVFKPDDNQLVELKRENEALKMEIEVMKAEGNTEKRGSSRLFYFFIGACIGFLLSMVVMTL